MDEELSKRDVIGGGVPVSQWENEEFGERGNVGLDREEMCRSISVVMLTHNQKSETLRCLRSLREHGYGTLDTVVWDNASSDGTAEAIRQEFPNVRVEKSGHNYGVAEGRNRAAAVATDVYDNPFLLFLDNDTILTEGFLGEMRRPFQVFESLGATCAKIRFSWDKRMIDHAGGCEVQYWCAQTHPIGSHEVDVGQYDEPRACLPNGGGMLVRSDVFWELNGFDSEYNPYLLEDTDFSLRMYEEGYWGLYVPDALIYHDSAQTVGSGNYTGEYANVKVKNWLKFIHRHAPIEQKVLFWTIGAPYAVLKAVSRELRSGNTEGVSGILKGMRNWIVS